MTTITIPKKLKKEEELVAIPRREYEKLLRETQSIKKLDRDLMEALEDVKAGRVSGPFSNVEDLMKSLNS